MITLLSDKVTLSRIIRLSPSCGPVSIGGLPYGVYSSSNNFGTSSE